MEHGGVVPAFSNLPARLSTYLGIHDRVGLGTKGAYDLVPTGIAALLMRSGGTMIPTRSLNQDCLTQSCCDNPSSGYKANRCLYSILELYPLGSGTSHENS